MSRKSSRSRIILFTIFALILFFVILNLALRPALNHDAAGQYEGLYTPHPKRMFELKPGAQLSPAVGVFGPYARQWKKAGLHYPVRINSKGFREREFTQLPEKDTFRVICIGDSSTFGWDVKADRAFPKILEAMIPERLSGRQIEVLNCGVPGYSSHQGRIFLEQVIWDLHPDFLVVAFGRNDEIDTRFAPTSKGINRPDKELMPAGSESAQPLRTTWKQKARSLPIYRFVMKLLAKKGDPAKNHQEIKRANEQQAPRRVSIEDYKKNLEWIITKAERKGIPVALVSLGMFFEEYRNALMEVGKKASVPAYDFSKILFDAVGDIRSKKQFEECRSYLYEALGNDLIETSEGGWLYYSTDFGHPNGCGHRVIAETLVPVVELAIKNGPLTIRQTK